MATFLTNWLTKGQNQKTVAGLPNPSTAESKEEAAEILSANNCIEAAIKEKCKGKKRKPYNDFDSDQRLKIAKLAVEIGVSKAAKKMSASLGKAINTSTVFSIKAAYLRELNCASNKDKQVLSLPREKRGRPLLLGDLDGRVMNFIRKTRQEGGPINRTLIMAAARGIVLANNKSLLPEFGGSLSITRNYAASLMKRMNFVKRKATKAARKLPVDFENVKTKFIERILSNINDFNIPKEMIVNIDQTGLKIVPVSNWTLEVQGAKQVPIVGLEDKREITGLLGISAAGELLPTQLIYPGKTNLCHPKSIVFPEEWDITHTDNHWSTGVSMLRYAEKILVPYFENTRIKLELASDQKGLLLLDVFKAHRNNEFIKKLNDSNINVVYVPASCTSELQPLDLTVNGRVKAEMKEHFMNHFANIISKSIEDGKDEMEIKVNLTLSYLKPIHANWIKLVMLKLSSEHELIKQGFRKAGLLE